MPRYHSAHQCPVTAILRSLAKSYHCKIFASLEDAFDMYAAYRGRIVHIGTLDSIKDMTVRGLISFFDEITQDWRYKEEYIAETITEDTAGSDSHIAE